MRDLRLLDSWCGAQALHASDQRHATQEREELSAEIDRLQAQLSQARVPPAVPAPLHLLCTRASHTLLAAPARLTPALQAQSAACTPFLALYTNI